VCSACCWSPFVDECQCTLIRLCDACPMRVPLPQRRVFCTTSTLQCVWHWRRCCWAQFGVSFDPFGPACWGESCRGDALSARHRLRDQAVARNAAARLQTKHAVVTFSVAYAAEQRALSPEQCLAMRLASIKRLAATRCLGGGRSRCSRCRATCLLRRSGASCARLPPASTRASHTTAPRSPHGARCQRTVECARQCCGRQDGGARAAVRRRRQRRDCGRGPDVARRAGQHRAPACS
jgi:hypothetical protein